MLGVESLDLVLMVADSSMVDAAVHDLIGRSQVFVSSDQQSLSNSVKQYLSKWQVQARTRLTKVTESERFKQEISLYQQVIHWSEAEFLREVEFIVDKLKNNSAFYLEACQLLDAHKAHPNPMFPHLFCTKWQKALINSIKEQQSIELEDDKAKVLKELYRRLDSLRKMKSLTGIGKTESAGKLWDMAGSRLTKKDLFTLKFFSDFLSRHPKLVSIAEKLGRAARDEAKANQQSRVTEHLQLTEDKAQLATDNIVGLKEGSDLNHIVPSEMMFLSSPELEPIFYKRFIDKRLLNYQMEGKIRSLRKVTVASPDKTLENLNMGPFIICIDASGSMSGYPEKCAKAFAYALMKIAIDDKRDCYLTLFSSTEIHYELTSERGLKEVADFLTYQFHGGTDLEPVLLHTIELMGGRKYMNADLLIVSDFIAPKQSDLVMEKIQHLKQKNNRFHAISLSKYGNPDLMAIFDTVWDYHPSFFSKLFRRKEL